MIDPANKALRKVKRDWEDLANLDPLWAILIDPERQYGRWETNEFFLTGQQEIARVMATAQQLGYPGEREVALDFGCGVGRLTKALSKFFQRCYGVDISEGMISRAKELNRSVANCEFVLNTEETLSMFPACYFDMIYTRAVLQHQMTITAIESYILDFQRVLKPGGLLVFDLPCRMTLREKVQRRRRLYAVLRALGLGERSLYEKLGLFPIRMTCLSQEKVLELLAHVGATVLKVEENSAPGAPIESKLYFVSK